MTNTHPRERLIRTAATLVHQQGWTATGINQILADAGIPKGSFYYYFRSKEALGVALVHRQRDQLRPVYERTILNPSLGAKESLYEYLKDLLALYRSGVLRYGCPIGGLANEVSVQSPILLEEVNQVLSYFEEAWTALVARGQREGSIRPDLVASEVGKTAAMLMQGAFLSLKCTHNESALELANAAVHGLLFGSATATHRELPRAAYPEALAS